MDTEEIQATMMEILLILVVAYIVMANLNLHSREDHKIALLIREGLEPDEIRARLEGDPDSLTRFNKLFKAQ
jgi:hypothetical protein